MIRLYSLVVCSVAVAFSTIAIGQDSAMETSFLGGEVGGSVIQEKLDNVVALNRGHGGGVFRVEARGGEIIWEGRSGRAEVGGREMSLRASFEIASTSKAFTAAAVLLLVEDRLLDLDRPIGRYLPPRILRGLLVIDGRDFTPDLTLKQLLNHTSGLPDYWNDGPYRYSRVNAFLEEYIDDPNRFWSPEAILDHVRGLTPIARPGTTWHYSDTGFVLAGLIVERVTGKSLAEVYRERIFEPLRLTDTWLHWRDSPPNGLVESHRYEESWDMYPWMHNSADWAGGGLVSSTRDLARFLHAVAEGSLFSKVATRNQMMAWVPTGRPGARYGLGLFRVEMGSGLGWVWGHDGYGNSWMYYWPRHAVAFVGTLNQTENDWWDLLIVAAREIEQGRPTVPGRPEDPPTGRERPDRP